MICAVLPAQSPQSGAGFSDYLGRRRPSLPNRERRLIVNATPLGLNQRRFAGPSIARTALDDFDTIYSSAPIYFSCAWAGAQAVACPCYSSERSRLDLV